METLLSIHSLSRYIEFLTLKSTYFKTRINTVGWSDEENHCVQCILWDGNCPAGGDPWEIDLIINKPADVGLLESGFCFKAFKYKLLFGVLLLSLVLF